MNNTYMFLDRNRIVPGQINHMMIEKVGCNNEMLTIFCYCKRRDNHGFRIFIYQDGCDSIKIEKDGSCKEISLCGIEYLLSKPIRMKRLKKKDIEGTILQKYYMETNQMPYYCRGNGVIACLLHPVVGRLMRFPQMKELFEIAILASPQNPYNVINRSLLQSHKRFYMDKSIYQIMGISQYQLMKLIPLIKNAYEITTVKGRKEAVNVCVPLFRGIITPLENNISHIENNLSDWGVLVTEKLLDTGSLYSFHQMKKLLNKGSTKTNEQAAYNRKHKFWTMMPYLQKIIGILANDVGIENMKKTILLLIEKERDEKDIFHLIVLYEEFLQMWRLQKNCKINPLISCKRDIKEKHDALCLLTQK